MTGIVFAALKLILRQMESFPLSRSQLSRTYGETVRMESFDCSLANVLRTELVASMLVRFNVLPPERCSFGAEETPVMPDWYNTDETPSEVALQLLRGGLFGRRLVNGRNQRSRYLRLPPTLDRLCFSRLGEYCESTVALDDLVSVTLQTEPRAVALSLTGRREVVLQCDLECEATRWAFYLKVVVSWYRQMGRGILVSMKEKLDEESRQQLGRVEMLSDLKGASELVRDVVTMIQRSFEAFIGERCVAAPALPLNIDQNCAAASPNLYPDLFPQNTVPRLLQRLVAALAHRHAFFLADPLGVSSPPPAELRERVLIVGSEAISHAGRLRRDRAGERLCGADGAAGRLGAVARGRPHSGGVFLPHGADPGDGRRRVRVRAGAGDAGARARHRVIPAAVRVDAVAGAEERAERLQ